MKKGTLVRRRKDKSIWVFDNLLIGDSDEASGDTYVGYVCHKHNGVSGDTFEESEIHVLAYMEVLQTLSSRQLVAAYHPEYFHIAMECQEYLRETLPPSGGRVYAKSVEEGDSGLVFDVLSMQSNRRLESNPSVVQWDDGEVPMPDLEDFTHPQGLLNELGVRWSYDERTEMFTYSATVEDQLVAGEAKGTLTRGCYRAFHHVLTTTEAIESGQFQDSV